MQLHEIWMLWPLRLGHVGPSPSAPLTRRSRGRLGHRLPRREPPSHVSSHAAPDAGMWVEADEWQRRLTLFRSIHVVGCSGTSSLSWSACSSTGPSILCKAATCRKARPAFPKSMALHLRVSFPTFSASRASAADSTISSRTT